MADKVCFRGDSRRPTTLENMFTAGFQKRNTALPITMRSPMGPKYAGDVEPVSAVCVSARISGAALFPLFTDPTAPPVGPNYMYMMAIDTGRIFNTALAFLRDELASHRAAQPLPTMAGGYHASTSK